MIGREGKMQGSTILPILLLLLIIYLEIKRQKTNAVIASRLKKRKSEEIFEMRSLAEKFIGEECLVYTIASETSCVKGKIVEITDSGILIENGGNKQAVNLEFVTRIREWPKNARGKKKTTFLE